MQRTPLEPGWSELLGVVHKHRRLNVMGLAPGPDLPRAVTHAVLAISVEPELLDRGEIHTGLPKAPMCTCMGPPHFENEICHYNRHHRED